MSFVVLDLEWNGSYSSKEHRFVNEIIEFGAVKTDDNLNIIDRFEMLISPQIGKKLCSKVKKLTKITNEELRENGCTFMHAVSEFKKFCGDCVLVTWGTSDILALIENYMYYAHRPELPFLTSYCNVQDYCEKCLSVMINLLNSDYPYAQICSQLTLMLKNSTVHMPTQSLH